MTATESIPGIKPAPSRITTALSLPSHYLNLYSDFVITNASAVSQIESGLRSLTYIIPGRFRESEIASESLHSGVQLLSLYHDSLLAKAIARLPVPQKPHPSPHNRYTRFWTQRSGGYRRVALLLQMIQYTELLWEMSAKRRGEKAKWRVIMLLETVKAICRLILLRLTNRRPLLTPPLPEREIDPAKLESTSASANTSVSGDETRDGQTNSPPSEPSSDATSSTGYSWIMPRTGLSLPTLPDATDISNYLLSKVLKADDIKPPKALMRRVSGKGEIAEIMYILRPVLYAWAMQRWSQNKRDWRPWLLGVSMEYGARQIAKQDIQQRIAGGLRGLTTLEKEEMKKRGWSMGWWLMRGAFYENVTKGWIHGFTGALRGKPVLDLVGGIVEDYQYLWDEYYFSTATL